jgi:hypothetical protein
MQIEHGLITVAQAQNGPLPDKATMYLNLNGIVRRVRDFVSTSRGLRAVVATPEGDRRVGVYSDDLIIISFDRLAGKSAEDIMLHSRRGRLPAMSSIEHTNCNTVYSGVHCG